MSDSVTKEEILGTWDGEYSGSSDGEPVQRKIRLSINRNEEGSIAGVAYIDDGNNGSYYFTGSLDPETKDIQFYGYDWYDNPSGFSFSTFLGRFDPETGTISGTIDHNENRTFALAKTADEYEITAVSPDTVPLEWEGEYDGYRDEKVVRRNISLKLTDFEEYGNIEAKVYIYPSDLADINDSVYGRYYARGTMDYASGKTFLQGYEWIWYPVPAVEGNTQAADNFEFVMLNGRVNQKEGTIKGYSEKGIWDMKALSEGDDISSILVDSLQVGDKIGFGKYDTDGIPEDEESLMWTILDKQGTKVLLLSSEVIDAVPFHEGFEDTSWETSTLRGWLNHDFYQDHFSESQQIMILDTTCENEGNSRFMTGEGAQTTDRIFLLSEKEVTTYLTDSETRTGNMTDSLKNKEALLSGSHAFYGDVCAWMLRTNGASGKLISFVDPTGEVNYEGVPVNAGYIGLRPAMWVDLGMEE